MSLAMRTKGWRRGFDRDWQELVDELPVLLNRGGPVQAVASLALGFLPATFVDPAHVAPVVIPLGPLVERAAAERQAELDPHESVSPVTFETIHLANIIECVGGTISPATHDIFRDWLSGMRVSRDDENTSDYWSTYFSALALDDPHTYRRCTPGPALDEPLETPLPNATFGPRMRDRFRYFAAAVEQRVPYATVAAAWEELLVRFPAEEQTSNMDNGTLLWAARVVYHRIAGTALGTVAQRLHEDLWRLAALEE